MYMNMYAGLRQNGCQSMHDRVCTMFRKFIFHNQLSLGAGDHPSACSGITQNKVQKVEPCYVPIYVSVHTVHVYTFCVYWEGELIEVSELVNTTHVHTYTATVY